MNYAKRSIEDYLKDLSARTPAPGGGSSAALSAAMSAGLIAMVCQFTCGKEKYKRFTPRLQIMLCQVSLQQKRCLELLDEDVRAYASGDIEESIRVPLEICFLSYDLIKSSHELLKKGNTRLASDTALAAGLAEAAFTGAFYYVLVNVKASKEKSKKYKKEIARLKVLKKTLTGLQKKIEVSFGRSLGW
jgi:formiminotetrahydrofolate cyclodeaminase